MAVVFVRCSNEQCKWWENNYCEQPDEIQIDEFGKCETAEGYD